MTFFYFPKSLLNQFLVMSTKSEKNDIDKDPPLAAADPQEEHVVAHPSPVKHPPMTLRKRPPMTAAGKNNLIDTLKSQIKSSFNRLKRQLLVLDPLLESTDMGKVNHETSLLDRIYSDIAEAHARLCATLDGEDDRAEFDNATVVLDGVDDLYFSMKSKLCTWQLECEKVSRAACDETSSQGSRNSRASSKSSNSSQSSNRSQGSRKSKASKSSSQASRCSNKSLELKAKIAGVKAEFEAIKKTSEAQLAAQLLEKEQKIRKMEAMEKVYAEAGLDSQSLAGPVQPRKKERCSEVKKECEDGIETKVEPSTKKRKLKDKVSLQHGGCEPSTEGQLQHVLTEMIKVQSAPKPDLDVLSENPLDYPFFKASFKEVVEIVVEDQRGRLTRLIRYMRSGIRLVIPKILLLT